MRKNTNHRFTYTGTGDLQRAQGNTAAPLLRTGSRVVHCGGVQAMILRALTAGYEPLSLLMEQRSGFRRGRSPGADHG